MITAEQQAVRRAREAHLADHPRSPEEDSAIAEAEARIQTKINIHRRDADLLHWMGYEDQAREALDVMRHLHRLSACLRG